jgi:GT2 family glycosyltransferase
MVIVNWNEKQLLQRCLETLRITDYPELKVVVVDNGSSDSSAEMVRSRFGSIDLIANATNLGHPKAVNQGMLYAVRHQADYVLVMNNDIEFLHPDWLSKLTDLARDNSRFGIIGPKLLSRDGGSTATAWLFRQPFTYIAITSDRADRIVEADYVQGSALLIRREVIRRIGFFDEA